MSDKLFNYPDDFSELEPLDNDPGIFETVEEEPGKGPCGGIFNAGAGYGATVKDCKNVSEEEKKCIGDKAAAMLRNAVIRSCNNKGCAVGTVTQNYRRTSCRKNHYTVVVGCKFTCVPINP